MTIIEHPKSYEIVNVINRAPAHPAQGMLMRRTGQGSGRYYFEAMLIQTAARVTVGVVDGNFLSAAVTPGASESIGSAPGVGDDNHSWGICGHRSECGTKHAGVVKPCGEIWTPGDVVGVLIDLNRSRVSYYVNGKELMRNSHQWTDGSAVMTPAVTLEYGSRVQLNMGQSDIGGFWYPPPPDSVAARLRSLEMQREWVAENAAVLGMPLTIANAENVTRIAENVNGASPASALGGAGDIEGVRDASAEIAEATALESTAGMVGAVARFALKVNAPAISADARTSAPASLVVTDGLLLTQYKHVYEVSFMIDPTEDRTQFMASFGWWTPDDQIRKACHVLST